MFHRFRPLTLLAVALLVTPALTPRSAAAGPLDPPAGPVVPTNRTVISSIPFTIDASGSYVLTGNLSLASPNFTAITINTSNVTIDFAGFTMTGRGANTTAITVNGSQSNIHLSNGMLTNWGFGIGGGSDSTIQEMTIQTAIPLGGSTAISLGANSSIRSCRFGGKVLIGDFGQLDDVTGVGSSAAIGGGKSCVLKRCRIINSEGQGVPITLGEGSVMTDCAIQVLNGTPGPTIGVSLGNDCIMSSCTVLSVGIGQAKAVSAGTGCLIERSTIRFPGTAISVTGGCTVRDCTIVQTAPGGIGASVIVLGSGNRIEGNQLQAPAVNGPSGILVDAGATNNLVIRNSVTGPTSLANAFSGTANNTFGPIIDARLIGQLNGTTANQAHPWANFWY